MTASRNQWTSVSTDVGEHGCELQPHVRQHLQCLRAQHVLARTQKRWLLSSLRAQCCLLFRCPMRFDPCIPTRGLASEARGENQRQAGTLCLHGLTPDDTPLSNAECLQGACRLAEEIPQLAGSPLQLRIAYCRNLAMHVELSLNTGGAKMSMVRVHLSYGGLPAIKRRHHQQMV